MKKIRFRTVLLGSCFTAMAVTSQLAAAQTTAVGQAAVTPPETAPAPAQPAPAVQTAPEAASSDAGNASNGDIIVTAQRRSENLARTPVSVAVLSGDLLAKRVITTEADLQSVSPGLTIRASTNSNQLNYAIRGQSLDAFSGTRPGVLPYVNEVQVGGAGGSSAFYDLQSIQVLKGPQGTLFGRNATGGAVLFTTTKPTNTLGGYLVGRLGNYNDRQFEGAINAPLIDDKLLLRVAGFYQGRDGFQKDIYKNERAGDVDRFGVRGSLTFKPVNGVTNDLVVDYYHAAGNNLIGPVVSLNPKGALPLIALTNAQTMDATISALAGVPGLGNGSAAAYFGANPKLDRGGLASYVATQKARGPFVVESNAPNGYLGHNLVISNITAIDVGENTQIRNVIGFTRIYSKSLGDIDGSPYGIDDGGSFINKTRQFSEELQLVGKTFDNKLSYVTGLYYAKESNIYLNTADILSFPIIKSPQSYADRNTNKTYAIYGQGTFDLSSITGLDGLSVTAGVRYTSEKIGIKILPADISFTDSASAQATYDFDQSSRYKNVSWTLGLQEQVNSELLLYAASRRSYRNGGFNDTERPVPGLGSNGGNAYGTETVTDGELGAKYSGRMGGIPVRANLALYQDWIRNSQRAAYVIVAGSPAVVTVNVPRSRVRGVELDTTITPTSWLQVGGAGTFTDAKFTSNLVSVNGGPPVVFGTYPDTPKWTGSGFVEITAPVTDDLAATFRSDVYGQTRSFYSSTGNTNPGSTLPGYALVNFRIGVESQKSGWSLSANLKNAFNHTYYVGGIALGELFQFNTVVPGDPRTILFEARYKF
jgi:iron complex outermembrane receptor protein